MGNICIKKKKRDYLLEDSLFAIPSPISDNETMSTGSNESKLEFKFLPQEHETVCILYSGIGSCHCEACKNICKQCYYVFNDCICNTTYYDTGYLNGLLTKQLSSEQSPTPR